MPRCLLFLLILGAAELADGPIARAPRAGETVRLSFEQSMQVELALHEDFLVRAGEETSVQRGSPVKLVKEDSERIAFTDEILDVAGGRALRVRRSFEEIATRSVQRVTRPGAAEQAGISSGTSALEGRSVLFQLDPARAVYTTAFADGEPGEERWLAGLELEADLSCFLPRSEVEPGATWSIEPSAFRRFSSPGGELALVFDDREPDDEFGRRFHEHLDGRIDARSVGREEGTSEAPFVIHLSADLETDFEMPGPAGGGELAASGIRYRFHVLLEGELAWDTERGRARAMDWEGPVEIRVETRRPLADAELLARQLFRGRLRFSYRFR